MMRHDGVTLPPADVAPLGACWDGADNDGDGDADYPEDRGSDAPHDPSELGPGQTRQSLRADE